MNKTVLWCSLALVLISVPAIASERIDGEIGAMWWSSELEAERDGASGTADAAAPGFRAELWLLKKYGMRAAQFGSNPDGLAADGADYTSLDVMWRPYSPSDNNFVAVGVGWQQMDFAGVGVNGETSGMRLSAEGRVGFMDKLYGYGQGAYLPALDDVQSGAGQFEEIKGYEYELGVAWNVMPFLSLRAGYRANDVEFSESATVVTSGGPSIPAKSAGGGNSGVGLSNDPVGGQGGRAIVTVGDGSTQSSGFFVGLGFRF